MHPFIETQKEWLRTDVPAFRAGDTSLTLLAFSTREPNDIVFFPRSGKVGLRGIKARFFVTQVDYWDGEA